MATLSRFEFDVGVRDLAFGVLCLAAVALTVVVQFVWMIVFDEVGFDQAVPDAVFTIALPALTLAVIPAAAATVARYDRRTVVAAAVIVAATCAAVATHTVDFFTLCGRGC